jgi:fused signal recognition particle receptor
MDIIVAVVVAFIVLGVIVFLVSRRTALPPSTPSREEPARPPAAQEKAPSAKAEKAAEKAERKSKAPAAEPAKEKEKEKDRKSKPAKAPTPEVEAKQIAPEPVQVEPAKVEPAEVEPAKAEPIAEAPKPETAKADAQRESVAALKKGLAETRGGFIARLAQLFGRKKEIDPGLLDEIQAVLITADIGPRTTEKLLDRLRDRMARRELGDADAVWKALGDDARTILGGAPSPIRLSGSPTTILIVGVNGVGKTTTIGKLASHFRDDGKKVVLAAGDTFRAAAVLQLEVWGKRVGCHVVKGKERADPGSVIFDAIKHAQAEKADVVLADTAGRLHTKSNLMEELKKVVRTAEKALERPVDHILLVLDATTGQNAIQQAQLFKEAIPVSGIVLTKLDGTAKGGVVLGITDEHGIPVRYVGIGERVEDLREFDPEGFVSALFEKPEESAT